MAALSFGPIAGRSTIVPGTLTPFRALTGPPSSTVQTTVPDCTPGASLTTKRINPSAIKTGSPAFNSADRPAYSTGRSDAEASTISSTPQWRLSRAPRFKAIRPGKRPSLSFGPGRSAKMQVGLPSDASNERMRSYNSVLLSGVPCE